MIRFWNTPCGPNLLIKFVFKKKKEEDIKNMSWPLILYTKGIYSILILPMVEPGHLNATL